MFDNILYKIKNFIDILKKNIDNIYIVNLKE